jgi:hypothetical protein
MRYYNTFPNAAMSSSTGNDANEPSTTVIIGASER